MFKLLSYKPNQHIKIKYYDFKIIKYYDFYNSISLIYKNQFKEYYNVFIQKENFTIMNYYYGIKNMNHSNRFKVYKELNKIFNIPNCYKNISDENIIVSDNLKFIDEESIIGFIQDQYSMKEIFNFFYYNYNIYSDDEKKYIENNIRRFSDD